MRIQCAVALALAGLLTISCGGISSPSQNAVDPFSGTLQVGGEAHFQVNVGNTGEYSIKITALSPTPTAFVGVRWYLGANCDFLQQQNTFSQINTPALVGAILQKGAYCVQIFDVGALTVPQTFTITVSHP